MAIRIFVAVLAAFVLALILAVPVSG